MSNNAVVMRERALLGGLMNYNELIDEISPLISPESFTVPHHASIYRHIQQQAFEQKPFEMLDMFDLLGDKMVSVLAEMVQESFNQENTVHQAKEIADGLKKRKLTQALTNGLKAIAEKIEAKEVINSLNMFFLSLEEREVSEIRLIGDSISTFMDGVEQRLNSDNSFIGLSTGLVDLDKSISGMQPGNLIVIAGRPAMGKSVLAMNIGWHNANEGKNVVIFTLEMTEPEIQERLVSSVSHVDYQTIQDATFMNNDNDFLLVGEGLDKIGKAKFFIDDSSSMDIFDLRSKAITHARKNGGVDLIIVDYLQLLSAKSESRFQEVSIISRELKKLAKDLQCPVIALSQLNRSLESRSNKRPILSDLRESGQIEQDADKIIFVYREEIYDKMTQSKGLAELIIGKARNCPKSDVVTVFDGARQSFRNADQQAYNTILTMQENKTKSNFSSRYNK